jgi:hypothetical protein
MHDVPLSILSRSLPVNMWRGIPKKRFQKNNPAFQVARELNQKWKATVSLNLDPELPAALRRDSRLADNCRPLASIADTFGPVYGEAARAALIELCADLPNQDPAVAALSASVAVFKGLGSDVDRLGGKVPAKGVVEQDDYFCDWRGANDRGLPHELTSGELSRLLSRFDVYSRTLRFPGGKFDRGYMRVWIESAWRHHSPENDTSTQPRKIIALAKS